MDYDPSISMIRLRVFGAFRLEDERGQSLVGVVDERRVQAVLVFLALARPFGAHQRDRIVGLLWPELDQQRARAALRKALHRLRKGLGGDVVSSPGAELLSLRSDAFWCN